jgi:carbohydrate-selective porin OprB
VFNPEDAWGLGFARIKLEDDSKETLTELYYNLHLAEKLRLSGHLQYAKESPLGGPSVSYLVTGLRFQASF